MLSLTVFSHVRIKHKDIFLEIKKHICSRYPSTLTENIAIKFAVCAIANQLLSSDASNTDQYREENPLQKRQ